MIVALESEYCIEKVFLRLAVIVRILSAIFIQNISNSHVTKFINTIYSYTCSLYLTNERKPKRARFLMSFSIFISLINIHQLCVSIFTNCVSKEKTDKTEN